MEETLPDATDAARQAGRNSTMFGLLATAMSLLAFCSTCTTAVVALPLGILAILQARRALESDDELARTQGQTGMALGIMTTTYSALLLMIVLAYILFYVFIFAAAIGGAAMVPQPGAGN